MNQVLKFAGVIGLLLLVVLVAVLFSKTSAQSKELAELRQESEELQELREEKKEGQRLRNQLQELDRFRKEAEEVHKLRNETRQFRQQKEEFEKLNAEVQQLRGTIAQLKNVQAEKQRIEQMLRTQIDQQIAAQPQGVSSDVPADPARACINNLRQIQGAKEQWALENRKTTGDPVPLQELVNYFKDNNFPICPNGGNYTLGAIGQNPLCSVPGHSL